MAWKTTWNDPLTNYVAPDHQLMRDKRKRTAFDETIRGIMGAGSLILKWMPLSALERTNTMSPDHHRVSLQRQHG